MNKAHTNVNWENLPSTNTPLNQQNLNQMDNAIDTIDDRVIVHDNEITQLQGYETRAAQSATAAANSASTATTKATAAATSATNSENFYKYSKSYAVGGTGIRSGEDTDNSKYYYEQVKSMASGGHAIMDSNGTAMTGRSILQFANSRVKDDSANDKTIVAPAHGHTNLIDPTLYIINPSYISHGITITNNGDGTFTMNGTSDSDVGGDGWIAFNLVAWAGNPIIVDGIDKIRFCGTPSGLDGKAKLQIADSNTSVNWYNDTGDGTIINTVDGKLALYTLRIEVQPNTPFNDVIFKPMISTDLSVGYDDFVAYSGNGGLNENVANLYKGLENTDANLADVQSQIVTSGNIENGNTATSAHTVGTYIQWKGKFYVVTSAIAVGDTLAVGTNLAAKTVGDVLTQINADLSAINTTAVTASNAVYHIKHVHFDASVTGGVQGAEAIGGALPFKTVTDFVPMQGLAQSSGIAYNFYFDNRQNTIKYAQQVPADRYYFDLLMYAE